jgi:hypothetical protein
VALAVTTSLHIDFLRKPELVDVIAHGELLKLNQPYYRERPGTTTNVERLLQPSVNGGEWRRPRDIRGMECAAWRSAQALPLMAPGHYVAAWIHANMHRLGR